MKCRFVQVKDYELLRDLAYRCKPLDLHTPYTYWVCCNYFPDFCIVLENENNTPIGYIMGLVQNNTAFVWQIGILEEYRGKKCSVFLLDTFIKSCKTHGIDRFQTTIDPLNQNSNSAFKNYAFSHSYSWTQVGELTVKDSQENKLETEHERIFEMKFGLDL